MDKKDPNGYRKLLAYQKAQTLHDDVLKLVSYFPQTPYKHTQYKTGEIKTIGDLADQMPRSGRSTHKNIVEGWKRNTTQEYFDFLSYSIGSNAELKDDAADIVTGKYKELMGIKGIMGERGNDIGSTPTTHFTPSSPLTLSQLDAIPFYPLNSSLPLAVRIYLQAKEVDYLLHRLQTSLDVKMDKELTKSQSKRIQENMKTQEQQDQNYDNFLKDLGLKRLENGQVVKSDN